MLKFLTKNKTNKQNKKLLFFPLKSTIIVKILENKPIFNDPFFGLR